MQGLFFFFYHYLARTEYTATAPQSAGPRLPQHCTMALRPIGPSPPDGLGGLRSRAGAASGQQPADQGLPPTGPADGSAPLGVLTRTYFVLVGKLLVGPLPPSLSSPLVLDPLPLVNPKPPPLPLFPSLASCPIACHCCSHCYSSRRPLCRTAPARLSRSERTLFGLRCPVPCPPARAFLAPRQRPAAIERRRRFTTTNNRPNGRHSLEAIRRHFSNPSPASRQRAFHSYTR